jgi:hypothetical protein
MEFNLKSYRILKIKKYFKNTDFFFFFNTTKLTLNQWLSVEQDLKKSKLKHYKILNGTTLKTLKKSVFKNLNPVICGVILFIKLDFKSTELDLNLLSKNFKNLFSLISVKLNCKVYSVTQIKKMKRFSYRENMLNLQKILEKTLKTSYIITNPK